MAPQVNGEAHPSSAFFQHLLDYPVISDGVTTIKQNPYGKKSIQLSDSAYQAFAAPIIPYLSKPYQYVSPYVHKADSLGDSTLSKIDGKFPVLKKPAGEIYTDGKNIVFFPLQKALEGKDHVLSTYSSEKKKFGDESLIAYGKAALQTGLIISTETLSWARDFFTAKKAEAEDTGSQKVNQAKDTGSQKVNQAKDTGSQKVNQAKDVGSQKVNQAKDVGSQKVNQAKDVGSQKVNQANAAIQK